MEIYLTATECHLPYGITQCYLPPDTSEHTTPSPQPDRLVLDLPTTGPGCKEQLAHGCYGPARPEPTTYRSLVQHANHQVEEFVLIIRRTTTRWDQFLIKEQGMCNLEDILLLSALSYKLHTAVILQSTIVCIVFLLCLHCVCKKNSVLQVRNYSTINAQHTVDKHYTVNAILYIILHTLLSSLND